MKGWFTWRVAVGSIVLGLAFSLSGLDLFFAITTVISLGFNLWQLFRDRYKYTPLKDSLIGLFNDLKGRQLRAYQRQLLITSPAGNALAREAIQPEFYDFAAETTHSFEQLREHVVAAIHTLDPEASTQQVFRASEFGLNEQERRFRTEGMERFIQNARAAAQPAPQTRADVQAGSNADDPKAGS